MKPESFALQMWMLKKLGYRGCSITEAVEAFDSNSNEKLIALTFDDGYWNFITQALPVLSQHGFTATVYVVTSLIGESNQWDRDSGISANSLMDASELLTCMDKGIEIGCHSATHPNLTEKGIDLAREIGNAKDELEGVIDLPVKAFCYPYGKFNTTATSLVQAAGFSSATTMIRSRATSDDNRFLLPRVPVTWHTLPHLFAAKVLTGYEDRRRSA